MLRMVRLESDRFAEVGVGFVQVAHNAMQIGPTGVVNRKYWPMSRIASLFWVIHDVRLHDPPNPRSAPPRLSENTVVKG